MTNITFNLQFNSYKNTADIDLAVSEIKVHYSNVHYYKGITAIFKRILQQTVAFRDKDTKKVYYCNRSRILQGQIPAYRPLLKELIQRSAFKSKNPQLTSEEHLNLKVQKRYVHFGVSGFDEPDADWWRTQLEMDKLKLILGEGVLAQTTPWEYLKNHYKCSTDDQLRRLLIQHEKQSHKKLKKGRDKEFAIIGGPTLKLNRLADQELYIRRLKAKDLQPSAWEWLKKDLGSLSDEELSNKLTAKAKERNGAVIYERYGVRGKHQETDLNLVILELLFLKIEEEDLDLPPWQWLQKKYQCNESQLREKLSRIQKGRAFKRIATDWSLKHV